MSKRLLAELSTLMKENNELFSVCPLENDIHTWFGYIWGPKDTPYETGKFYLTINFPNDYPYSPPLILFKTKIYHPNINENGSICMDILKNEWSPILTTSKVMYSLISLLSDPNPNDPLVEEIARLMNEDYDKFIINAKNYTKIYANIY
jgi:ubiquitin-conjugating enzyme E2 D/E